MQFVVQETSPDVFAEVPFGSSIIVGDVVHPWQITGLWPAAELQAIGVYLVDPAQPPAAGATVKGYRFERHDGVIVQILDVDLPAGNALKMSATARQIRLAINQLGLREEIEQYVASQSIDVRDSWQFTSDFQIDHPFIVGAKEQLNKSDDELIGLFSLAQTFA